MMRTLLMHVCRAFDKLKEVRQLEYELDFAQNRARRDLTALQAKLDALNAARCADMSCQPGTVPLISKCKQGGCI
jgi:hypothetical protein